VFLKIIKPAESEPVSLDKAKAHCRIDNPHEDALISGYISAAREYAELITRRSIARKTILLIADFKERVILPRPQLIDVLDVLVDGKQVPYMMDYDLGSVRVCGTGAEVRIKYEAGYIHDCPASIKQGILDHVAQMYEYRGDDVGIPAQELGKLARVYYHPHRIMTIGDRV